jgi:hypothetical protein
MDGTYLLTAFDLNMIYDSVFHSAKWFKQLELMLLISTSNRLLINKCPPHLSLVKTPTRPVNFNASATNPTFVVIWSNQYMTFILGKVVKVEDAIIHAQHYLPNQTDSLQTPIVPCTRCNLFDHSAFIPYKQQQRHHFCAIKLPKSFCSIFKTFHKPREGWWCSLSHPMLREVALSTLTSPYQYPTKHLPNLDVIPFDQSSINTLDRLKLLFTNANAL